MNADAAVHTAMAQVKVYNKRQLKVTESRDAVKTQDIEKKEITTTPSRTAWSFDHE